MQLSPFQGALLGLLAAHGRRGIRRGSLVTYLWVEGTEPQLRRRLSQHIYSLHRRLKVSGLITAQGDVFFLDLDRISTDLDDFLRSVGDGQVLTAAEKVMEGFLSALEAPPTPELESWIRERDLRYRGDVRTLAAERWAEAKQRADWEMATEAATALHQLDPRDEAVFRQLLEAHALTGRTDEGSALLRTFAADMKLFDPEWEPEAETVALAKRLKTLDAYPARGRSAATRPSPSEPPLVGREEEFGHLTSLLRTPPRERIETVVLCGEAGVGKTRLAHEALKLPPLDGLRVLAGGGSYFERRIPLAPLLDSLKEAWVGAAVNRLENPWRAVLLAQLPEFHDEPGPLPPVPTIAPGEVPHRLCEAFRRLFQELTASDPVILFLDDLQWADETSLSVLEYLRRRWDSGGLILFTAVRIEDGTGETERVRSWLQSSQQPHHEIELAELHPDRAGELVRNIAGEDASEDLVQRCLKAGGGIPLFLLHSAGDPEGAWGVKELAGRPRLPLSHPLERVLTARLQGLSSDARKVLEVLAVSMRQIDEGVGTAVAGVVDEEWWAALQELEGRFLVSWTAVGATVRHDLIRKYVVAGMDEARWRGLNRRMGDVLKDDPDVGPEELAFHYFHGKKPDEGRAAAREAAGRAERTGAFSEALKYLSLAVALARSENEKVQGRVEEATALFRFGRFEDARRPLEKAIALCRTHGRDEQAAECEVALLACEVQLGRSEISSVLERLEGVVTLAVEKGWWSVLADALDWEARLRDAIEDVEGLRKLLERTENLLPRVPSLEGRVRLLSILALGCYFGDPDRGREAGREAVALAQEDSCSEMVRLNALNRLLVCLVAQGLLNTDEGRSVLDTSVRLAERSGSLSLRFAPTLNQAAWLLDTGEPQACLDTLLGLLWLVEGDDRSPGAAKVWANWGHALVQLGEYEEALVKYEAAQALATPTTPANVSRDIKAGLGLCNLSLGRLSEAAKLEKVVRAIPSRKTSDPLPSIRFLSELDRVRGRGQSAARLVADAAQSVRGRFPVYWISLVSLEGTLRLRTKLPMNHRELSEAHRLAKSLRLAKKEREIALLLDKAP